jgi:energy-converting hydrogenase Eha subunit G
MTEQEQKLVDALISALTLSWDNNGNILADAVRDACIQVVADSLGTSFAEVLILIDKRADEMQ